jgi:hypothetical protein
MESWILVSNPSLKYPWEVESLTRQWKNKFLGWSSLVCSRAFHVSDHYITHRQIHKLDRVQSLNASQRVRCSRARHQRDDRNVDMLSPEDLDSSMMLLQFVQLVIADMAS